MNALFTSDTIYVLLGMQTYCTLLCSVDPDISAQFVPRLVFKN